MTTAYDGGFRMEVATTEDLGAVLPVVRAFYQDFGFAWDDARKRGVLARILAGPDLGRLWVVSDAGGVAGYALVMYFLSLEFEGRVGVLDEFYLEPRCRGKGLGGWVLEQLAGYLAGEGIGVIRLELDERHPGAKGLYQRAGFRREPRQIWSRSMGAGGVVA